MYLVETQPTGRPGTWVLILASICELISTLPFLSEPVSFLSVQWGEGACAEGISLPDINWCQLFGQGGDSPMSSCLSCVSESLVPSTEQNTVQMSHHCGVKVQIVVWDLICYMGPGSSTCHHGLVGKKRSRPRHSLPSAS